MNKSYFRANFFLILSKTAPEAALNHLTRIIEDRSYDELLQFTSGRREVVWALEEIAKYQKYFYRSSKFLLKLAEAENESCVNNATGVFLSLFKADPEDPAPTETPLMDRFPMLRNALSSDSSRGAIGIRACASALGLGPSIGILIDDSNPLRRMPVPYMPKSWNEIVGYKRAILEMLAEQMDHEDECGDEAIRVILDALHSLDENPELAGRILDIVTDLHNEKKIGDEKLLNEIIMLMDVRGVKLDPHTLERLNAMRDSICGTRYSSRMRRYVGMDIITDMRKSNGAKTNPRDGMLEELADMSADISTLRPELSWLVTNKARHGYVFGYKLAQRDPKFTLLPEILNELRNAEGCADGVFVGGYLAYMYKCDAERWDGELDNISQDPLLQKFLPEITYRSGLTDKAAERIIHGIHEHKFDYTSLAIFCYGAMINNLSEGTFTSWIELLQKEKNEQAILIALDLFRIYFVGGKRELPHQLTLDLLLHSSILSSSLDTLGVMGEYHWNEIGMALVAQKPDGSISIARTMIENFDTVDLLTHYYAQTLQTLNEIVRVRPQETWQIISGHMGPPLDEKTYNIRNWLRTGALSVIPIRFVFTWIDEGKNDAQRLIAIAQSLPPSFESVREFLTRYGDQEEFQRHLSMNFSNEIIIDSSIGHYTAKKQQFEDIRASESDPNVCAWLDYYIRWLSGDIEREKKSEERLP